jgi:hypothetical protein
LVTTQVDKNYHESNINAFLFVSVFFGISSITLKKYLITAVIFLTVFLGIANSNSGVVVLMNGKIVNAENGKPVTAKVKFVDENGKVHSSSSNSSDGVFQQVIPSGYTYSIFFDGWLTENVVNKIVVPKYSEYSELGYEFKVTEIKQGLLISKTNFFEKNSDKINPEAKETLQSLKDLIVNQKGIVFEVSINSADSYFQKKTVKESYTEKGRKKTRNVVISTEKQLLELLDKRKENLINLLDELKIHQKSINMTTELIVVQPKPKAKIKTKSKSQILSTDEIFADNLIIRVDKVMKF